MKNNNFTKVFDLFINTKDILSLRKFETKGINIFEFDIEDLERINEKEIIENIPTIYILEESRTKKIYIGETDNFSQRIKDHIRNNKSFDKVYVINASFLNKNICLEIESKTISMFKNSINNYKIENSNENNNSYISTADELRLYDYMQIFKEIYSLLRFNLVSKEIDKNDLNEEVIFSYKNGNIKVVDGGFLLLKDSKISMGEPALSVKKPVEKQRKELLEKKIIDESGLLLDNYFSKYPSNISKLISGQSSSGYFVFKNKDNKTLGDFLNRN